MRTDRVRVETTVRGGPEVVAEAGMSGAGSLSSDVRSRHCLLGEPTLPVRAIV